MMVEGFDMKNPMALVGIRKHDMDPMMDEEDDYIEKFAALYPTAMVDFEIPHTHIGDATDGEFYRAEPQTTHLYTKPEECDACGELEDKIEEL